MLRFLPLIVIPLGLAGLSGCAGREDVAPAPTAPTVTSDQLLDSLLTEEDIAAEFPLLGPGDVRHLTNELFAEMIPGATASDVAARGFIDAFDKTFIDSGPPVIETSLDRPAGLVAIVHLLDSVQSADSFMDRGGISPGEHMRGTGRGASIIGTQELAAPEVGERSAAVQVTNYDEETGRETTEQVVFWRRGPMIGRITIQAIDQQDRGFILERLARKADQRMMSVLDGGVNQR